MKLKGPSGIGPGRPQALTPLTTASPLQEAAGWFRRDPIRLMDRSPPSFTGGGSCCAPNIGELACRGQRALARVWARPANALVEATGSPGHAGV